MDLRPIKLDEQITERCVTFANALVRRYANGETPQSLAFSSHGMEKDQLGQARAKMAECILAVWLGAPLDPLFDRSLRPWDMRTRLVRIDVKQTKLNGRYLIWPLRKNSIFADKDFDVLALVKNDWNIGFPQGWIKKWEFFRLKSEAGPDHKLTCGTWFVDEELLEDMADLPGCDAEPVQPKVMAGPTLQIQIAAVVWAAKYLDADVWRRMREEEQAYMERWLAAASATCVAAGQPMPVIDLAGKRISLRERRNRQEISDVRLLLSKAAQMLKRLHDDR